MTESPSPVFSTGGEATGETLSLERQVFDLLYDGLCKRRSITGDVPEVVRIVREHIALAIEADRCDLDRDAMLHAASIARNEGSRG